MSMAGGAVLSASFNEIFVLVQSTCGSPALFLLREASQGLLSTQGYPWDQRGVWRRAEPSVLAEVKSARPVVNFLNFCCFFMEEN